MSADIPFELTAKDGTGTEYKLSLMPRRWFGDVKRHECGLRLKGPLLEMTVGINDEQRLKLAAVLLAQGPSA